jgi:DNA-binding LytR/AlgR family response regulator
MYNVLIVEDALLQAKVLEKIFKDNGAQNIVIEKTGAGAIQHLAKKQTDLALLDIDLADDISGIDVAMFIEQNCRIPYLFLSNNIGKDNKYFDVIAKNAAIQYLPKGNWLPEQVLHFVDMAFYKFNLVNGDVTDAHNHKGIVSDGILVKEKGVRFKVLYKDIQYLEAKDDYVKIHYTSNKHLMYRSSIKGILKNLDSNIFLQVHQSIVINKFAVKAVYEAEKKIILNNATELPIGKTFKDYIGRIFL